jgi:nicotinamide-nucleotide amidase
MAARIVTVLARRGQTLATAESLTGGLLGAAITAIPGASTVYRGGIVAYATELKAVLLGVPDGLLARHGPVHPSVAAAMAAGARDRLGATWGLATTGVAGPDPVDGLPPGTVHIAASAGTPATRSLALAGGRDEIRRDTVAAALKLLWERVREDAP